MCGPKRGAGWLTVLELERGLVGVEGVDDAAIADLLLGDEVDVLAHVGANVRHLGRWRGGGREGRGGRGGEGGREGEREGKWKMRRKERERER